MLKKNVPQVLLLSTSVLFLTAWAGAQSTQGGATAFANVSSSVAAQSEQQEMREELRALRAEVERLRAEVEQQKSGTPSTGALSNDRSEVSPAPARTGPGPNVPAVTVANLASPTAATSAAPVTGSTTVALAQPASPSSASQSSEAAPAKKEKIDPFSDWDWTWLNGNPRTKEAAFDSKFFTPEIRADVTYTYDFNRPVDNTISGSSEIFRSNEVQLEQLGLGGDFHYDNVRARFMTQFGMYSATTPRNDPSPAKGQWDLHTAYRYLAEAYGGYHINALNGINVDAGIFLSYIGLFSYYNFDNWAYQPSYVSSNTPWFFNGLRVQIFPNPHLKIEPWLINGWQSYGSANSRKGLGGQIKWTPRPWVNVISNNYGLGHDDLYIPNRGRIHTDDSVEIKYYDQPEKRLDKMAFSFTGDMGCEFGPSTTTSTGVYLQGVGCHGNTKDRELGRSRFVGRTFCCRHQSQAELHRLHAVQPLLVRERSLRIDSRRRPDQQSRTLSGSGPSHQRRDGGVGGDQCSVLYRQSVRPIQGLGFVDHVRLHAQAVHHVPLGIRLSPCQCAVLVGPRWSHAAGYGGSALYK